jgi:hypothetical protein
LSRQPRRLRPAGRARRYRGRLIGLVIGLAIGLAASASLAGCGTTPGSTPSRSTGQGTLGGTAQNPPRLFAATVQFAVGGGPLQVRTSGTGSLVSQDARTGSASGLAAAGKHSLVIALPVRGACATRLYRVRLNAQGRPGRLHQLGRKLHGELWSVAASANGQLVGYAISGCAKGDPGYVGVTDLASGRSKRWADVNLGGVSPGSVALSGGLSMSASGGTLAYTGWDVAPGGQLLRQVVGVLSTTAPPGTLASRSRIVLSRPVSQAALQSVALSPDGTSFYLCTASGSRSDRKTAVASYRTSSGSLQHPIATLSGAPLLQGCSLALDASGRFLLVSYGLRAAHRGRGRWLLQVASIDVVTRQVTTLDLSLMPIAGMDPYAGIRLAW